MFFPRRIGSGPESVGDGRPVSSLGPPRLKWGRPRIFENIPPRFSSGDLFEYSGPCPVMVVGLALLVAAGLRCSLEEEGGDISKVLLDDECEGVQRVVLSSGEFGECLLEGELDVHHSTCDESGID